MKNIKITNYRSGYQCGGTLEDDKFQGYIDKMIAKEQLFKPQREIRSLSEDYAGTDIISARTEEVDGVVTQYVTLKAEHIIEIVDITEAYNAEQILMQDLVNGEKIESVCNKLTRFLNGYLDRKNFSKEQEDIFDLSFAKILTAIDRQKIKKVRKLVDDLVVDGEIITDKLKETCLLILTKSNF